MPGTISRGSESWRPSASTWGSASPMPEIIERICRSRAAAESAVLVGVSPAVARAVRMRTAVECEFGSPSEASWRTWLRAIRVHQWVKNFLIFVPYLTALPQHETGLLVPMVVAFLAFCLAASGCYLLNHICDLESDRLHLRKRLRPFASGALPLATGLAASAALLVSGVLMGAVVSPAFAGMVVAYVGVQRPTHRRVEQCAHRRHHAGIAIHVPRAGWIRCLGNRGLLVVARVQSVYVLQPRTRQALCGTRGPAAPWPDDFRWPRLRGARSTRPPTSRHRIESLFDRHFWSYTLAAPRPRHSIAKSSFFGSSVSDSCIGTPACGSRRCEERCTMTPSCSARLLH